MQRISTAFAGLTQPLAATTPPSIDIREGDCRDVLKTLPSSSVNCIVTIAALYVETNGAYYGLPGPTNGFWGAADWLFCRDGKWRPVEPGTQPLAHGAAARVGRLRGYGNAIVAPAAQVFIEAYLETEAGRHLQLTPETDIFS